MPRFKLAMFQKKFVSHPMALPGQEGGQAIVVFFIALFSHHSFGFLHRLRNSALNPIPSVILSKKISNAPCILKTRAILMPLEVYMVNSPSRPILRPDAPSTPVECGGRTPLWNRETCLPAHRMPVRNQTKSNHQASASRHLPLCMFFAIAPPLPSRSPNSETPTRFFPIKAKTPLIVHHQGISRQTLKFLNAVVGRVTPCAPSGPTKTPPLATIRMANQDILVDRRRRAEDCPPYLARIIATCTPARRFLRHWMLDVLAPFVPSPNGLAEIKDDLWPSGPT